MKSIILIKQHSNIQLGHLYEHLFLSRVNRFFYENGAFKFLDYSVHGTTYDQGGIITVECDIYSKEASQLEKELAKLHIDFGQDNANVILALHQICAEESEKLRISNIDKLLEGLRGLDHHPWQYLDEFTALDTKKIRKKTEPIYLTDRRQPKPRNLHVSLILDKEFARKNRQLLPLFMFIGRVLMLTINNQITARFGAYAGSELSGDARTFSIGNNLWVAPRVGSTISIDEVHIDVEKTLEHMNLKTLLDRIIATLKTVNYEFDAYEAPNIEVLIKETNILLGSKGWEEVATNEHAKVLLEHMLVEVKFGKESTVRNVFRP